MLFVFVVYSGVPSRGRNSPPGFLGVCVAHLFNFVCAVLLRVFTFLVPYFDAAYKRCSVRRYLLLFVGVLMSYLHYLCMRIVV